MTTKPPMSEVAVWLAHTARNNTEGPKEAFVALMTAAAVAGHIIARTPEEMAEVLAKVEGLAHAKMLEITETKQ